CAPSPRPAGCQFTTGSTPNRTAAAATSPTAGVGWSPVWVDGLTLRRDWYNVEIEQSIVSDSVDNILRDCYVAGVTSRCESIVRNANGTITDMFYGLTNAGGLDTEGYDFGVNYRLPEFAAGQFTINWQSSYVSKFDSLADNAPETLWEGNVGYPGFFRVRSNLGVNW